MGGKIYRILLWDAHKVALGMSFQSSSDASGTGGALGRFRRHCGFQTEDQLRPTAVHRCSAGRARRKGGHKRRLC